MWIGVLSEAIHRGDTGEERLDGGLLEEEARPARDHRFQCATAAEREHGAAGGLGLERRDAEVLLSRQHEERRARIEARKLLVRDAPEKADGGAGLGHEPRKLRPVASNDQLAAEPGERLHGELEALVRNERGDD